MSWQEMYQQAKSLTDKGIFNEADRLLGVAIEQLTRETSVLNPELVPLLVDRAYLSLLAAEFLDQNGVQSGQQFEGALGQLQRAEAILARLEMPLDPKIPLYMVWCHLYLRETGKAVGLLAKVVRCQEQSLSGADKEILDRCWGLLGTRIAVLEKQDKAIQTLREVLNGSD